MYWRNIHRGWTKNRCRLLCHHCCTKRKLKCRQQLKERKCFFSSSFIFFIILYRNVSVPLPHRPRQCVWLRSRHVFLRFPRHCPVLHRYLHKSTSRCHFHRHRSTLFLFALFRNGKSSVARLCIYLLPRL